MAGRLFPPRQPPQLVFQQFISKGFEFSDFFIIKFIRVGFSNINHAGWAGIVEMVSFTMSAQTEIWPAGG